MLRVLIIGGYGFFGGRLARLLEDDPSLTLILAGRSRAKAQSFAAAIKPCAATIETAAFDRTGDVDRALAALTPDAVVDASGPWQMYGDDPYRLARAALRARSHYIDLADAAAFVIGISLLDPLAKRVERAAISGASTVPALSFAALDALAQDFTRLDSVEAGIAPSPKAGVGPSVLGSLMSYAGKPVRHVENGRPAAAPGLVDSRRFAIAPPGIEAMAPRRFALVDVPEYVLLPEAYPGLASIWFGAGPAPPLMHRLLWCAAKLVEWRIVPSLLPFAPLFSWSTRHIRWGPHRGGMYVQAAGLAPSGEAALASWHLIAEGDSGPHIPAIPAAILIRRLAGGQPIAAGARPAHRELALSDFEPDFARLGIVHGVRSNAGRDS